MNPLRDHLFTGSPMSRYEFAIRLLAEGAAESSGGIYSAGTLMMAAALFSSMPPETLMRIGEASTEDDHRIFDELTRRQRGIFTARDRAGGGVWPHYECGVRDFLARELVRYMEEIREALMSERLAAGYSNHEFIYVQSAADTSEIAVPYTSKALESEFRRALGIMGKRYPKSHICYQDELTDVSKLTSFLLWTVTSKGRRIADPLSDEQASMLLYSNSKL